MGQNVATAMIGNKTHLPKALRYAAAGLRIFPVNADKQPLTQHGFKDATSDPAVIEAWWQKWPHCEFGWAVPADVVVVDIDVKHGKHGYDDFKRPCRLRSAGRHDAEATTPQRRAAALLCGDEAVQERGRDRRDRHRYPRRGRLRRAARGGQRPRMAAPADRRRRPLLPAPAWLDCALRKAPSTRAPLVLAPRAALAPPSSDPWAQRKAQAQLERACARIVAAPCGAQDSTRHAQCFYIGGLIARGDLGYEEAYAALLEAALRHAGLSRSVAQSRGARRPLDRGRHGAPARSFAD